MDIKETRLDGVNVVNLEGILNAASAPKLKAYMESMAGDGALVINLEQLDFIDSSGLGILVGLARKMKSECVSLKLANMNDRVKRVFEITQAHSLFDIYDDLHAATEHQRP